MTEFVDSVNCLMCCEDNDKAVGFCSEQCKANWFQWPKSETENE